MKRGIFLISLALVSMFMLIPVVCAIRSAESGNIENKTPFNYKGKTLYASLEVTFNIDSNGFTNDSKIVPNVNVSYDETSDIFYLSVKRSDINKLFTQKYDNVYSLLQGSIDYHSATKEGGYFLQLNHNSQECGYTLTRNENDYYFNNYGYLEVFSSTVPLSGSIGNDPSIGGGVAIVDTLANVYQKSEYCMSDLLGFNPVINIEKTKMVISIIEDERIDLGENDNVISSRSNFADENEENDNLISEDINSFYAEYDEKNKLKYSWSLYDENGAPLEINYDTQINLDNSIYEDEITDLFEEKSEIKDKLKFISFKHEGELGGTAKVSIYVGDKFDKGEKLNLFYYDKDNNELDKINVLDDEDYYIIVDEDGYVAFDIDHCSEYVLADSSLSVVDKKTNDNSNEVNTLNPYVIGCLSLVAIIILIIILLVIRKKRKNSR